MLLLLVAALAAPAPAPAPSAAPVPLRVTRSELAGPPHGLSGLAADDRGGLWAISERDVSLVPLRLDGDRVLPAGPALRVARWPVGLDAESLAWVSPGRFLVGTESLAEGRATERLLEVRVDGDRATVVGERALAYAPFGLTGEENRGVEALDYADGAWIAASEVVSASPRTAPLWRAPVEGGPVEHAAVTLTSPDGKLSALVATDGEILAIERHYGTVRLVAATVVWGPTPTPVPARVVRDLAAELGPLPNLEGLARLPDGRLVLLGDNQSGFRRDGPTVALVLSVE